MSHQCSCGRDLNNNYVSYTNAYANANSGLDRDNSSMSGKGSGSSSAATSTQLTAKVMFGTVGAIKELREKEKSRHATTRADLLPLWLLLFWTLSCFIEVSLTENFETLAKLSSDDASENQTRSEIPRPFLTSERESRQLLENEERSEGHTLRPSLMDIALQISARQGLDAMTELYTKIEPDMIRKGHLLAANHPAALLSKFSAPAVDGSKPNPEMAAFAVISATKAFRKNYKYINDLARQAHSPKISLRRTALESLCPPREAPTCMPASNRYRTHDGTCNSKRRPRWGAAQMPFNRFLPPVYGDGVDSIRNSVEGGSLSSSRFVSLLVHGARDGDAPLTLMIAQWGQLLDHDMTSTAQPRSINGSVPSCCGGNDFHPSCFPIKVPLDDPWLAPLKVRCLEFLRSAPAQRRDCILSWREQTNQATSYIDASPIYSNNAKSSDNARVFRKGLLVYGRGNPTEDVCLRGAIANQCIRAGDGRSGEQPGLLAMHHVWVGEHNRIALELSEINQHWSDEKIYQEARRIVGAMFQHITYREFLPLVLGKEVCKLFELDLLSSGYYEGYDSKVNPTVANSFAAAAFRFGHSLVQNSYMRCDRHHNIISNNVSLHEEFQRGDIGSAGSLHRLIRGMATQRALRRDEFITPELTNHLFQTPGFPFGLDLAAINIQRGRDHGIPAYTSWRIPCGLSQVNNWEDFENVVGPESAERIRHAYRSVHDIDLFVGGIAERPVIGGLVGPTFACIIAQQFSNSRKGDRFWYENGNFENSFTPAQLHALRRVSLAQVLCRTVGGGTFQPHIFIPPGFEGNQRLPCGEGPLAPIDLSAWQEQDPFSAPSRNPQHPDRVFNIISGDLNSNALTTVHVIKEEKVGFANRDRPAEHKTSPVSVNKAQIDLIPNASIGLHRPKNSTKISDKLDIRRKGSTTRKPVQNHLITGVNNKLDKNTRITLNIKGANRHRTHTTTRRTVIVNNVPIELRTADDTTVNKTIKDVKETEQTETTTIHPLTSKRPKHKKRKNRPKSHKTHEARLEESNEDVLPRPATVGDVLVFHDDDTDSFDNKTITEEDIFDIFHNLTEVPTLDDTDEELITELSEEPEARENDDELITTMTMKDDNDNESENENENDIDPLKRTEPLQDNKRVQRQTTVERKESTSSLISRTAKNVTKSRPLTTILTTALRSKNTTRTKPKTKTNITANFTVTKLLSISTKASTTTSTTTQRPRTKKTTQASVELRQYQTVPDYTRPHKVIVKGPNSDQYEIEINIRQTSSALPQQSITSNYAEYTNTNGYRPHTSTTYDKYSPSFLNYLSTTPAYSYFQQPATVPSSYTQTQRTRPPTVIYLNENDRDERTTTRQPSIFQNFLNFATNGLRPPTSVGGILTGQKERPSNYFPNSPHSSNPAAHQYGLAAPSPLAVGSLSQTGGLHASSSALSTGGFGAIVGVASANGGDSTFSFNIRPKPGGTVGFGAAPPQKPNFGHITSPEYVNLPISTATTDAYFGPQHHVQSNSPFSTNKRPHSHGYYKRTQEIDRTGILQENADVDYDYSSRMLEPLSNISSTQNTDDYQYFDDYDTDDNSELVKKYDRDGYLRPEHMIDNLFQITDTTQRTINSSLDDNYVLPVLNETTTDFFEFPKPMPPLTNLLLNLSSGIIDFPDTDGKSLNNDIQAENDYIDETTEPFIASKTAALKAIETPVENVAFAPITILTKPERPDNWVFYDTPNNKPLLPEPPEVLADSTHIGEIPKPFIDQTGIWLEKEKQMPSSSQEDDGTELPILSSTPRNVTADDS